VRWIQDESLCAEVADSISWWRFCRIPIDGKVPHPTTLMKLPTRCGEGAVPGLNEALWAKAARDKLLRTGQVRADTTVIAANVAYPTDSGLLAKAVGKLVRTGAPGAGGRWGHRDGDDRPAAGGGAAGPPDCRQAALPREAGPRGKHPGHRPGGR
jgi:IS5 family transposase